MIRTSEDERRTHERVKEYLNGRWEELTPETRLALTVIADELDGLNENVRSLRTVVVWVGMSIAGAILSLAITLLTAV